MGTTEAKFAIGQIVQHKRFDYRGVIVDVDPDFQGTEEWYRQMATSRPPRDKPWYHVLVHARGVETYVAERNLEPDASGAPVDHPYVSSFFSELKDGVYVTHQSRN